MVEEALSFSSADAMLLGVLARPEGADRSAEETAVLVVVGGPQYRAGSHRQFVLLARTLAAAGHAVLRFDCRGMGDSAGVPPGFEQCGTDIGAAIDALYRHAPQTRRVVLWGLCDGASAALLYLHDRRDERVAGLCLLNPWVRSDATLARTHVKHYYLQRLRQRDFWRKLLAGKVAREAASELLRNLRRSVAGVSSGPRRPDGERTRRADAPYQQRMAVALADFDGPVALMLSGNDFTAKEFQEHANADALWRSNLVRSNVTRLDFAGADHTFSSREAQTRLEQATLTWLGRFGSGRERA